MDNAIVIIGGMGPQASLSLHQRVVEGSTKLHNGSPEGFPLILHASLPVPDFIASPEQYKQALRMVQEACQHLPLQSAAAIGIACNTAHLMVDDLPLTGTKFVSMLDQVVAVAKDDGVKTVGLLASPHTVNTRLYQNKFEDVGVQVVLPNKKELEQLDSIIHAVIAGKNSAQQRDKLTVVADHLLQQGAERIVLGCTELPIVGLPQRIPTIDSLQALADGLLEKYYQRPV